MSEHARRSLPHDRGPRCSRRDRDRARSHSERQRSNIFHNDDSVDNGSSWVSRHPIHDARHDRAVHRDLVSPMAGLLIESQHAVLRNNRLQTCTSVSISLSPCCEPVRARPEQVAPRTRVQRHTPLVTPHAQCTPPGPPRLDQTPPCPLRSRSPPRTAQRGWSPWRRTCR